MEKLRDNYIMNIYKGITNEKITFINDTGSGIWVIDAWMNSHLDLGKCKKKGSIKSIGKNLEFFTENS